MRFTIFHFFLDQCDEEKRQEKNKKKLASTSNFISKHLFLLSTVS
jgi:hypothetical protein